MDECWLLDETLLEDDVLCCELVAVDASLLDDGVTVTVTVDCASLLHSDAPCEARGAAAASPSREAMKILECILSKGKNPSIKIVLKIVCLKTLITRIRSLENDSRKDASERMCKECVMKDELKDGRQWGTSPFLYSTGRMLGRTRPCLFSDLAMCCIRLDGRDFADGLVQTESKKLDCSQLTRNRLYFMAISWRPAGVMT